MSSTAGHGTDTGGAMTLVTAHCCSLDQGAPIAVSIGHTHFVGQLSRDTSKSQPGIQLALVFAVTLPTLPNSSMVAPHDRTNQGSSG
eukprot:294510-Rhodomonas_salina.3